MWHGIEQHLRQALGNNFSIEERQKLPLKSLHQAYLIQSDQTRIYLKLGLRHQLEHFQTEAEGVRLLKQTQTLTLPDYICDGICKDHAFIAYHYLPSKPLTAPDTAYQFGKQLAQLHQWGEQVEFGLDEDNYLEHLLQPNQWHKKWSTFFADHRIGWQLQLLKEKGLVFTDIEQTVQQVQSLLSSHQPKPSLLHGNLTPEHIALTVTGPSVFQPACYWGDREYDVAILLQNTELNPSWLDGYQSVWPLQQGYRRRLFLYQLYHQLNQCNHFGGDYIAQCEASIAQLTQLKIA